MAGVGAAKKADQGGAHKEAQLALRHLLPRFPLSERVWKEAGAQTHTASTRIPHRRGSEPAPRQSQRECPRPEGGKQLGA